MCRNCGTPTEREILRFWCNDCVRAFAKGLAAAVGAGLGGQLAVRWLL